MKTADRENPNRWAKVSSNRAHGAAGQNRSCSFMWAAKQETSGRGERFLDFSSPELFSQNSSQECHKSGSQSLMGWQSFARNLAFSSEFPTVQNASHRKPVVATVQAQGLFLKATILASLVGACRLARSEDPYRL
jgi:hypothetical protein